MGLYITQTDLAIPEDLLVDLTDDAGAGVVDTAKVDQAILDAEAVVDGYCATRYAVPFAVVPALVKRLAKVIAEHELYQRRDRVPEAVQKAYDGALAMLRDISAGKLSLGVDPAPAASAQAGGARVAKTEADRLFTRDTLRNF